MAKYLDETGLQRVVDKTKNLINAKQDKLAITGSSTQPVYVSASGTVSAGSTYAGGTKVTLNGSDKGGSTASFYAPTSAGTSGYFLKSNGSGEPSWQQPIGVTELSESNYVRIADLNAGIYALTKNGAKYVYYNGNKSDTVHIDGLGTEPTTLIVNNGTSNKSWFAVTESGIVWGKTNSTTGSSSISDLTTTSSVTQSSSKPITSGGVYDALQNYVSNTVTQLYGGGTGSNITITNISNYKFLMLQVKISGSWTSAYLDTSLANSEITLYPSTSFVWEVSCGSSNFAQVIFNANSKTKISLACSANAWLILSGVN